MKWTTKTGNVLNIKDMTTRHIKNTINFIEKNSTIKVRELDDSGYDGDSYVSSYCYVTYKATKTDIKENCPEYNALRKEYKRRLQII